MALVVSSWADSYRTAHAAGMVPMDMWGEVARASIARVLGRPGVEVWVAYHPGEDDPTADLYGWLAAERGFEVPGRVRVSGRWQERMSPSPYPLVHYAYVRLAYRRQGIARGLCAAAGVDLGKPFYSTCKTTAGTAVVRHLGADERWNPLIARHSKSQPQENK